MSPVGDHLGQSASLLFFPKYHLQLSEKMLNLNFTYLLINLCLL